MTIQEQLDWIIAHTTVLWIERHDDQRVVAGNKEEIDRFFRDQGDPVSFSDRLEPHWQRKFGSFGDQWGDQRQKYRLLYDTMRAFFVSFVGLRLSKVASINAIDDILEKLLQGELAGSHLMQMYVTGAKAIHLMSDLQLTFDPVFTGQFTETRNKLFEHNHNPNTITNLVLEPSFWDIIATKSFLPIYIHTTNEREFEAHIDYYQDYYDLEQIFLTVVEAF